MRAKTASSSSYASRASLRLIPHSPSIRELPLQTQPCFAPAPNSAAQTRSVVHSQRRTPPATDGVNVAFQNHRGYLSQVLERNFQHGDNFELKVDIGWRTDVPTLHEYAVQILAGSTVLASSGDQGILVRGGWATALTTYHFDNAHAGLVGILSFTALRLRFSRMPQSL